MKEFLAVGSETKLRTAGGSGARSEGEMEMYE